MESHVGIAVAVLYAYDKVAYDGNTRTVAGELLVGHLGVILLCLDELMVEVKVVGVARNQLSGIQERLHQKAVQLRGSIEVIALSCLRGIGRVGRSQLRNSSQNGVRAACA